MLILNSRVSKFLTTIGKEAYSDKIEGFKRGIRLLGSCNMAFFEVDPRFQMDKNELKKFKLKYSMKQNHMTPNFEVRFNEDQEVKRSSERSTDGMRASAN